VPLLQFVAQPRKPAGHLPPAVLQGDGSVRLLATRPERLLGTGLPGARTTHETTLHAGDTVLLYIDGLVEHGGSDTDAGLARLTAALEQLAGRPLEEFCDRLQTRCCWSAPSPWWPVSCSWRTREPRR
jgi:serine phosphatase RsbU (regulator of sigma subunit)